jgi:YebC/PmpR family DNA-binding regulatory protein
MAGHSKWKNIRIRKGKQDALRGKLFTKLSREIIVAARAGGGDPAGNARLRVAIEKAKESSLPADNIKRAIQRGIGEIEGAAYEEVVYEGYGPGGSAIMVECTTENRNRTVADLRLAFSKNGGSLSESGSVAWQFKRAGQIAVARGSLDEEEFTLLALEAGAEDVQADGERFTVFTAVEELRRAHEHLARHGARVEESGLTRIATNLTEVGPEDLARLLRLLETLEDLDDVQELYVNVDIPEEALQEA